MPYLDGVIHWVHILSAALAVGGLFFLRFILCPALKKLPPDQKTIGPLVLAPVMRRFKRVIHACITLLLLTGIYRVIQLAPLTKGWKSYQCLLGIKILFALVLFTIAILLTLPGEKPNYFQRSRDRWLLINFALGALILLISATLRWMWNS